MALQVPTVTVDDLCAFHAKHFLHASAPEHYLHGVGVAAEAEAAVAEEYCEEDDGLGYYPDGTKRTLTDEQIAMFRHSEIQAIARKRRLRREDGELSEDGDVPASPSRIDPVASETTTPSADPALSKVQSGRVEKPKAQQWATSSARTKAKNKRNRNKYQAKKKDMKLQKERAKKNADGEESESDEWDPWHQANGPDAQKEDALDLDY